MHDVDTAHLVMTMHNSSNSWYGSFSTADFSVCSYKYYIFSSNARMPVQRRKLVIAAWKTYLDLAAAEKLAGVIRDWAARRTPDFDLVIAPSFPHIIPVRRIAGHALGISAQNADLAGRGAYTGMTPPSLLSDAGCGYVMLGHSETRKYRGETDLLLRKKILAICEESDLHIILCIGESRSQKDAGMTTHILESQLTECLSDIPHDMISGRLDVAYEPLWAISSEAPTSPPDPRDVGEIHGKIRAHLEDMLGAAVSDRIRILYGGSVDASNVSDYMSRDMVDGVLVGSASTKLAGVTLLLDAVHDAVQDIR